MVHQSLPSVLIVGAGMSGVAMAIALLDAGSEDFVILEKSDCIGGTWRENTYPGLACDVPAPFYALRSDLNPSWSRLFAPGAEIREYFESVVTERDLQRFIRFGVEVESATYDGGRWRLTDTDGEHHTADTFVAATGVLHRPSYPEIAGLDSFAGPLFHSARWDHSVDLPGKRVGVVGTGSTGVQITTALADVCDHVVQFQRTPQWVATVPNPRIPRPLRSLAERSHLVATVLYEAGRVVFDSITTAVIQDGWRRRFFQGYTRRSLEAVDDPELRERLRPHDEPGCKRLIMSPHYYEAVQRPHVTVEDERIHHVDEDGVCLEGGRRHELDVLVLATGFDAQAYVRPMAVTGADGVSLDEVWAEGPFAHYTTTVPGFPNFFMLLGPNSPVGNSSLVPLAEEQAGYVVHWLRHMRDAGVPAVEPSRRATEEFRERVRAAMPRTLWVTGCDSWYLGPDGVPVLWPWSTREFRRAMREPRHQDFVESVSSGTAPDEDAPRQRRREPAAGA